MLDDDGSSVETPVPEESHLKYDKSGAVPIILVPQPSDDPNDPLVRKHHILTRTSRTRE